MSQPPRDSGYTLIEIMVVVGLVSLLAALGVGAWKSWAGAEAHKGAATDMQTVMRQTQVRAVTEGVSLCVKFDTTAETYTVYRFECATTGNVKVSGPFSLGDGRLLLSGVQFHKPDGTIVGMVTFRPSGSAWPGGLTIARTGSSKTYSLTVEGLTGRVSVS
jgi:prepilin-type N-terminal cleavage/methylation domain-containing protein